MTDFGERICREDKDERSQLAHKIWCHLAPPNSVTEFQSTRCNLDGFPLGFDFPNLVLTLQSETSVYIIYLFNSLYLLIKNLPHITNQVLLSIFFFLLKGTEYFSHVLRLTEPLEWGHGWPLPEPKESTHEEEKAETPGESMQTGKKKHRCKVSLEPGKRQ